MRACVRLIFLLMAIMSYKTTFADSKQKAITGTIYDALTNKPVPSVIVEEKETSASVISDKNGKYSINVISNNSVLVFSCLGYENIEENVGNRTIVNVKLTPTINNLNEFVSVEKEPPFIAPSHNKYQLNRAYDKRYSNSSQQQAEQMYIPQQIANTEEYATFIENKFHLAKDVPLSTFSIDVDAASYSNLRRFINQGQIPPKHIIRVEEMINYFDYNYPQPTGKHPINVITEMSECPWNMQNRLLHIGIKAKEIVIDELPGANLVFLIDVSGSMRSENKLPLVKASLKMLVKQLRDVDKVAIVTYAGNAGLTLESTSGKDKQKIINAIEKMQANGSTAGGAGIKLAYKIAKENFIKDGNNRIILATDGDFNVGVSSNEGLEQLIEKERQSKIFLTVLGYGMGNYKDNKMQILAQKGNGNHAYIDNLTEAKKVLVNEFGGTLFTIAKDVKLQLEFNPSKVQAYRLIGYESRLLNKEDFNDDTKDAGDMGTGHTVTALYEIIPVGVKSNMLGIVDDLKYQPSKKIDAPINNNNESLTVKIRYKTSDNDISEKLEVSVIDNKPSILFTSNNFRFSASVAQIGMLLYDSPYKSNASFENALYLAKSAYGEDKDGYRHEFVKLVENLQLMAESNIYEE